MPDCCANVRGSDCHCAACHRTFSSLALFDRHQDVDYARHPAVSCKAPEALGLVRDYRGTWTTPEAAISRQGKALAMAGRTRREPETLVNGATAAEDTRIRTAGQP